MKEPARVLILNERDPAHPKAGGAEIHVAEIFGRLAARGHEVTHLSAGFAGSQREVELDGIRICRSATLVSYYLGIVGRVRAARRRDEFDIVIDCLNKLPFQSPLYAGRPVLALCHHLFGEVAYQQVSWPIATAVVLAESWIPRVYARTPFVAISESTRDDLVHRGISADRIQVSHPGIQRPARTIDLEKPRPCRITYVGRLERYKKVDTMLRAARILVERFTDLEIVVIGRGPAEAELQSLAADLGLTDRTRFCGFVPDVERDALLAESRACVFPSPKEGWGLTVIEANALGTPVVASDAPGLRDSVRHDETGLLVASDRPEDFATAIAALLNEDEKSRSLRREAHAWSQRFDWEIASDEMQAAIALACASERK